MMRSKVALLAAAACLAPVVFLLSEVFAAATSAEPLATTGPALEESVVHGVPAGGSAGLPLEGRTRDGRLVAARRQVTASGASDSSAALSLQGADVAGRRIAGRAREPQPQHGAQALAFPAVPPVNDVCSGAVEIPACGGFPRITNPVQISLATPDGDPAPGCQRDATSGVWYSFTPTATGTYEFTTCQNLAPATTAEDTVLALFQSRDNLCPEKARIVCNDNDSACAGHERQSTLRAPLTAGRTYFLLAYTAGPSPGAVVQIHVDREPESRQCVDDDLDGTSDPCLPNGGFETGGLDGWIHEGIFADIAVVPKDPPPACFQPDMPSEGCYMACLSSGDFFGGAANGTCPTGGTPETPHDGVRSDLVSDPINFAFRPGSIEVSFTVEFQTQENIQSIGSNDAFQARLVTKAGTFVILQIDTFGRTPSGRGLRVDGPVDFLDTDEDSCPLMRRRTEPLKVTWSKTIDPALRGVLMSGPVFIEFSVSDQGDTGRTSIACLDDVRIKIRRPE